jgi:tetratricopeptide (TPR) repeat protein
MKPNIVRDNRATSDCLAGGLVRRVCGRVMRGGQARRLNHAASFISFLNTAPLSLALCWLLALAIGCAAAGVPKALTQGGVTPERQKRNEEAVRLFEQQRDFAEYETAKARWEQQDDAEGCREALMKLLARNPRHREARLLLAELFLSGDDFQGAYEQVKAALDAYPNDGEVQYTMALALDASGRTSDALAYYERATKMNPQSETFAAAYRRARETAREGLRQSRAEVLAVSETVDELAPQAMPVGYTPSAASSPTPGARAVSSVATRSADFAGIAEDDPALELLRRAQALLAEGSPQVALEQFRQAAATKPDNPQIPISAAAALLRANRPDLAVELLTPAAKRFSGSAAVYRTLGVARYRMGDYKSSQVALQQALSLDKSSALSYLLMGCTLAKLGQNESAEAHFRQARLLDSRYNLVR